MSNSTSGALAPPETDQTVQVWPRVPKGRSSAKVTVFTPSRWTEAPQAPPVPVELPAQAKENACGATAFHFATASWRSGAASMPSGAPVAL